MSKPDTPDTLPDATNIIEAADRFMPPRKPRELTEAEMRRLLAPAVIALPFITRRDGRSEYPLSFWNDIPSYDHTSDHKRGKDYARMTVEALIFDQCGSRPLEQIFAAIVKDAIARKARGGKHSRTLPPAVDGFLCELASIVKKALVHPEQPPLTPDEPPDRRA